MISSLYINNTPQIGKVINTTGNKVQIMLGNPIMLDPKKKYQVRLLQASIVYCDPNITSANNKFKYVYNGITHTCIIPTGIYSLETFNAVINQETSKTLNNKKVFAFVGDTATSQVYCLFYLANAQIDLSGSDNVMTSLLRFDVSQETETDGLNSLIGKFDPITDNSYIYSKNIARFNKLQSILVKCNICHGASSLNGNSADIIASITPNVDTWSTIQYSPVHPTRNVISVPFINNVEIQMVNQDKLPLDFSVEGTQNPPEKWNCMVSIEEVNVAGLL